MCRPAVDEARVPGEPQQNQQNEESQHIDLTKRHGPQHSVLLTDHVVGGDFLLSLHRSTAQRLPEAGNRNYTETGIKKN